MYFLRTERLGFRLWTETDLELAVGLWGDSEVTRLIGGPFSAEQVRQRLASEMESERVYGVQYWPLFLLSGNVHVGCAGLRPYEREERIYEIGVHLKTAYHGKGLAKEAAHAVIEYAFDRLEASDLFAGHHPANESSRNLLRKLGFRYTHDEHYAPTGLNHPSYFLQAEEYRKSRSGAPRTG